tara:strand:- start:706 stop:1728 length:1023 start_codon:yes stop_codon:yes gene_type:complete
MIISEVSISNLRATHFKKIKLNPGINILFGKNGIGKTTILESIYLLSYGKSFKSREIKTILGEKNKEAGAFLKTSEQNILKIKILNNKKNLYLDDSKVKKISEHISFLPCIASSPDEIIIEGKQNSVRQKSVNKVLCLIDIEYLSVLKKYTTAIKQRNAALKIGKGYELWEKNISEMAETVWIKREEYIKRLNKGMEKINSRNKTGLKTEIEENIPLDKTSETALENIIKNREKDVLFNKTSVGPHTDKIEYVINGKSVKTMASQGEKNMFFSIIKKAESNIIKKDTNKEPIVLLDDIFSKLDKKNTDLILEIFKNNSQTIITHTEEISNKNINQIMING